MWLKIKVWTKITIAAALILYVLLFIYKNSGKPVTFWWWFGREPSATVFTLSLIAFIAGMIATVLVTTLIKTTLQVRELRRRSAEFRATKELAELKTKASMLQTRPSATLSTASPSTLGSGSNVAIAPRIDENLGT